MCTSPGTNANANVEFTVFCDWPVPWKRCSVRRWGWRWRDVPLKRRVVATMFRTEIRFRFWWREGGGSITPRTP